MSTAINDQRGTLDLRDSAIEAFDAGLRRIEYPSGQIQRDYGYSNFVENGLRETVDLAAFGNIVPSLRTCNIGVIVRATAELQDVNRLRALGAPLVFTYELSTNELTRWRMSATNSPVPLDRRRDISIPRLPDYFADHGNQWTPAAFQQARAASFRPDTPQLDFFDIGLLPALEGQLQRKLSVQLQKTAASSSEIVKAAFGPDAFEQRFAEYARLLFRLLAARMLSDRGDLPDLVHKSDPGVALDAVERRYYRKEVFNPALTIEEVRSQVWNDLRQGLDLRNLSPESLAFVYENTLINPDLRKRNGIHATPPLVAEYLVQQLPIERISQDARVVFEPFCGNAPFLLAAMRRLRELLPVGWSSTDVHHYLTERLLGIEILPVAREIAVCSLILGDYPNENSWKIVNGDVFHDKIFTQYLRQAKIVFANPPHEHFNQSYRVEGQHHNQSGEALRRVIAAAPIMLGFVMPSAFSDGRQYKELRKELANTYSSIVVTILPRDVFSHTSQQVALVAAHNVGETGTKQYAFSNVSQADFSLDLPLSTQRTDAEPLNEPPRDAEGFPVFRRRHQESFGDLWERLTGENYTEIGAVADVHRGIAWQKVDGRLPTSDTERPGYAPGLHLADGVEAYFTDNVKYIDIVPEHQYYLTNALQWPWSKPKVLMSRVYPSSGIWRTFAVPDDQGLYASKTYIALWPKSSDDVNDSDISIAVLSAVMNGPVANAYLWQHCRARDNDHPTIKAIPMPRFSREQAQEIDSLVSNYLDIRWAYIEEDLPWSDVAATRARRALLKIDVAILDAYALSESEESAILAIFEGTKRSHLPFDFTAYLPDDLSAARNELAFDRETYRITAAFNSLTHKKNVYGNLTENEQGELEQLEEERMRQRIQYRQMIDSGK